MNVKQDVYDSIYLKEKYNIQLANDFGILLEDFVVEVSSAKDTNLLKCLDAMKLQQYVKANYEQMDWGMFAILLKENNQQYFMSKWLIRRVQQAIEKNNMDEFMNPFIRYFNTKAIKNAIPWNIKEIMKDTSIEEYANYMKSMFNALLEQKFFMKLDKDEMVYVFINLWKIVKAFHEQKDPIYQDNKKEFSALLKKVSILNEEKQRVDLKEFDLSYMDFSNMDLSDTYLYDVNVSHSNFESTYLDSICWSGSNLSYAIFDSAFMECAHLEGCNCTSAMFRGTHLLSSVVSDSNFSNVSLENANFMECDAERILVKGLKMNDKTAANNTDFRGVNWEQVDISGLSISDQQVSHFWEVVNYTRNTILYDAKFKKLDNKEIQTVIYKELKASSTEYLKKTNLLPTDKEIFISYASEEKKQYACPMYHALIDFLQKDLVWIDDQYLTLGNQLRKEIESVIRFSKLIIIIYSESYAKKGWTKYELLRILQEYETRKVSIILLNTMNEDVSLNSYQEICNTIPVENQFCMTNKDDQVMETIMDRIKALL